jgi:hypothetical protein
MGIDIYMKWEGMTEKEEQARYTGFNIMSGHLGYLREAYHGEPYATRFIVKEAFADTIEDEDGYIEFPAKLLRERLPETLELVEERYAGESKDFIRKAKKSYRDFVKLAERKEKETGNPVKIMASY